MAYKEDPPQGRGSGTDRFQDAARRLATAIVEAHVLAALLLAVLAHALPKSDYDIPTSFPSSPEED